MDNYKDTEETLLDEKWDLDPSASDDESFENELDQYDSVIIPDNRTNKAFKSK